MRKTCESAVKPAFTATPWYLVQAKGVRKDQVIYSGFRFLLFFFFCFGKRNRPLLRLFSNFQGCFVIASFFPDCMDEIYSAENNGVLVHPALCHACFTAVG